MMYNDGNATSQRRFQVRETMFHLVLSVFFKTLPNLKKKIPYLARFIDGYAIRCFYHLNYYNMGKTYENFQTIRHCCPRVFLRPGYRPKSDSFTMDGELGFSSTFG